jgi:chromosome segregation ATPase
MDEMAKIIKDLSNKISRMEIEKSKPDPYVRNKNQFRRNLNTNPHIQHRQIKNEEQKIQAPFKTKNLIHGDDVQDYDELDEDINNLSDDDVEPHLTKQ